MCITSLYVSKGAIPEFNIMKIKDIKYRTEATQRSS